MKKSLSSIINDINNVDWFQRSLNDIFLKSKVLPKVIDYFYASWAGECVKWIQYNMNGMIHDDVDELSRRRMDNGNYVHIRYGDYFESIGKLVAREPAFKKEMDGVVVSGRGDLIVYDYDNNEHLIEIKSINNRKFGEILKNPYEGDFLQWNLCSKALEVPRGVILYENKDTQEVKYHFVEFIKGKYEFVIQDFIKVNEHNKQGKLVPRPAICPNPKWCVCKDWCK